MRSRLRVGALAMVLAAVGCGGVPTGGAVHVGRAVPVQGGLNDFEVRVFPPVWRAGLSPQDVVAAYLHALVNDDDNYAIARTYLAPSAQAKWRSDEGITTYDYSALQLTVSGNAVHMTAPRLGRIDRFGSFQSAAGAVVADFVLTRDGGGWRIDKLPDGVLLSASDEQRAFRPADLYYLNEAGTALVPDQVLLPDSQQGVATTLVSALLAGPSDWLAPAVRTAFPKDVSLLGNVPIHDDGTVDVNLSSSVRSLSGPELSALSAQLVWTLRQVKDVTAVRLLADNAPLTVPGQPARQPISAWSSFNPAAPPAVDGLLFVRGGRLMATGPDAATVARNYPRGITAAARSGDGATVAAVQRRGDASVLLVGRPGHRPAVRLTAAALTTPTFDVGGNTVSVVTDGSGRHVVAVSADGKAHRLAADAGLLRQPVLSLQISRDGARVAAVVGPGRLLVGRVVGRGNAESLTGFRAVAAGLAQVRGVSWLNADALVVTCSTGAGEPRRVMQVDADGFTVQQIALPVSSSAVDVAAAPGQPLTIATDDGSLWQDASGWHRLGVGTRPVYSS